MSLFFKKHLKKQYKPVRGKCAAVIAAAGASQRMDGVNKQFAELDGVPVLVHTLKAFEMSPLIDEIIVVSNAADLERVSLICGDYDIKKAVRVVAGGETRLDSVMNGVFAVSKKIKLIAIHDGARPCVSSQVIKQTVDTARKKHAAVPVIPVTSTIKRVEKGVVTETVDREGLFEIQTPQVFAADIIKAALTNAKNKSLAVTDDCMAAEAIGVRIYTTEGSPNNIKITTKDDLIKAEAILNTERNT